MMRHVGRAQLAAAAAVIAIAALAVSPPPSETTASFTDAEVASDTITAFIVPPPTVVSCTASGLLGLGATATLKWKFPAGSGYTVPTNVQFWFANSSLIGDLLQISGNTVTTGPDGTGTYTTVFGSGLLTNLLGGSATIGVSSKLGTWTSVPVTRVAVWSLTNSCS